MGSTWGIPRTMAQAHALLYVIGRPMNMDEVMERLHVSRGNASMTLRALVEWGIVHRVHRKGDRKEYFSAEQDVWKMFRTIVAQRKKREIDPLLDAIEHCRAQTELGDARRVDAAAAEVRDHNERLDQLLEFIRIVDSISQRFVQPPRQGASDRRQAAVPSLLSLSSS